MKIFRLFDDDDSGTVTLADLQRVARELGEVMTDAELKEMIERADLNADGVISFDEFCSKKFYWSSTPYHSRTSRCDDQEELRMK